MENILLQFLFLIVLHCYFILFCLIYPFILDVAGKIFPLTFEEDFLVLPLDVTDFSIHSDCVDTVIKQFGQVKI